MWETGGGVLRVVCVCFGKKEALRNKGLAWRNARAEKRTLARSPVRVGFFFNFAWDAATRAGLFEGDEGEAARVPARVRREEDVDHAPVLREPASKDAAFGTATELEERFPPSGGFRTF